MKPYVPIVVVEKPTAIEEKKYNPLVVGKKMDCESDPEKLTVYLQGPRGYPGPTANPGPGFKLVGVELRYDIATLPRG